MTVSGFAATLPEFKGKDFNKVAEEAIKAIRRHKSLDEAVAALGELSTPALKVKCFVLCADIALSSGDVDDKEDALLEKLQGVLGVDQSTAAKVIEVLSLKYAR
jgi:tellurite resistance protein